MSHFIQPKTILTFVFLLLCFYGSCQFSVQTTFDHTDHLHPVRKQVLLSAISMDNITINNSMTSQDLCFTFDWRTQQSVRKGINEMPVTRNDSVLCDSALNKVLITWGLPDGAYALTTTLYDSTNALIHHQTSTFELENNTQIKDAIFQSRSLDSLNVQVFYNASDSSNIDSIWVGNRLWYLPKSDTKEAVNTTKKEQLQRKKVRLNSINFSSFTEFRDEPMLGSLYDFPISSNSIFASVSVLNVPIYVEAFTFYHRDQNSVWDPDYSSVKFGIDISQIEGRPVDTSQIRRVQQDIQQDRDMLSLKQLTLRNKIATQTNIPSDSVSSLLNLNHDLKGDKLEQRLVNDSISRTYQLTVPQQRKLRKGLVRYQKNQNLLDSLKVSQLRIDSLKQLQGINGKQITHKELQEAAPDFSFQKLKQLNMGNIQPHRFIPSQQYGLSPRITGASIVYSPQQNWSFYGLQGSTRHNFSPIYDSVSVSEIGVLHEHKRTNVSAVLSRFSTNGIFNEQDIGGSESMLELSGKYNLNASLSVGVISRTLISSDVSSTASLSETSYIEPFVSVQIKSFQFSIYGTHTGISHENPLLISNVAGSKSVGARTSYALSFVPLKILAGTSLFQIPVGNSQSEQLLFDFGLETSFAKLPNVSIYYMPMQSVLEAPDNSSNNLIGTQNSITNVLSANLTYTTSYKNGMLSFLFNYQWMNSSFTIEQLEGQASSSSLTQQYNLSVQYQGEKMLHNLMYSHTDSDLLTNYLISYRNQIRISQRSSIGSHVSAGEQQRAFYLYGGIPWSVEIHKNVSLTTELGYYFFTDQPSSYSGSVRFTWRIF